ncbi:FecR domain-containing protein [Caballeronia sp. LZ035]|uniref:FecR domain-containing protein n=1 Tax=Caballeronia sp. LZ035 TaxID=3038568 RepID=UPI00286331A8|nr:FecR domain-containing protein [Caballeronia sp. LZ035]MDR5760659.1 FecR domain-containing protein [Caballeronia sp. LZ035]
MTARIPLETDGDEAVADYESLEQAAHWYAVLRDDDASVQDRTAWQAWLDARAEHRRAWTHIEAVSQRFEPLRFDAGRDAASVAMRAPRRGVASRRKALGCLAALAGSGMAGWFAWRLTPLPDLVAAQLADYSTGIGERRDITLVDDTRVWLNTSSAIDVDYDGQRRLLTLTRGEILVETGKDTLARPFFVDTRDGRLQALGTRFTVRQTDSFMLLAVFEGRVEIRTRSGASRIVAAHEQCQFDAHGLSDPTRADLAREAWARGVIIADNVTLKQFVDELSRYTRGHIGVDPSVASIRVVGRFPADHPEQTLAMLERDLPVRVHRTLPWWTSIQPR